MKPFPRTSKPSSIYPGIPVLIDVEFYIIKRCVFGLAGLALAQEAGSALFLVLGSFSLAFFYPGGYSGLHPDHHHHLQPALGSRFSFHPGD